MRGLACSNPSRHRVLLDALAKSDALLVETGRAWTALRCAEEARAALEARIARAASERTWLGHALEELDALDPQEGETQKLALDRATHAGRRTRRRSRSIPPRISSTRPISRTRSPMPAALCRARCPRPGSRARAHRSELAVRMRAACESLERALIEAGEARARSILPPAPANSRPRRWKPPRRACSRCGPQPASTMSIPTSSQRCADASACSSTRSSIPTARSPWRAADGSKGARGLRRRRRPADQQARSRGEEARAGGCRRTCAAEAGEGEIPRLRSRRAPSLARRAVTTSPSRSRPMPALALARWIGSPRAGRWRALRWRSASASPGPRRPARWCSTRPTWALAALSPPRSASAWPGSARASRCSRSRILRRLPRPPRASCKVSKAEAGGETVTSVDMLGAKARKEEIARMLAGASVTREARAAAGRLLAGA